MTAQAISTDKLSKTYQVGFFGNKRVQALQSLDLSVEQGQVFGLLGPNGAGKSTTIKILLDLIRPSSGRAMLFGHAPASVEARRQLGFLPENPAPYEYLTGQEFVTLGARLSGLSGQQLKSEVTSVIEQVGMAGAKDLQIRRYSKGMIQRISLAHALVNRPKLLILDEPTSGLDVLGRQLIRDIILSERSRGTTVLFCSHIIPDVESLCDHVAVIIGGKLVRQGSVSSLLTNESTLTEIALDDLPETTVESLRPVVKTIQKTGQRHIVRCEEAEVRRVLGDSLTAGARVVQLQRTRYSLEELFLNALKESGRKVGSDIS